VEIEYVATWNFRNLNPGRVIFFPGINVLWGANGQGKTNVLEALAVLGALRSFRTSRLRSLVTEGESFFRLEVGLRSTEGRTTLEVHWDSGATTRRRIRMNGSEVGIERYLRAFPLVVIAPSDRDLVLGKPPVRRAYLDRLTFLLHPSHLGDLQLYRKLLQQRNAALGQPGSRRDMMVWEDRLAEAAARVVVGRRRTVEHLRERFSQLYAALGGGAFPKAILEYPGESFLPQEDDPKTLAEVYRKRYTDQRDRDRETGYTTAGPHRHDLMIRGVKGYARDYLSAGQIKAVAAALRLTFVEQVEEDRGERLPLGIDDIEVELDEVVTQRFLALAGDGRQLVVTSVHPDLEGLESMPCHRFVVEEGSVGALASHEENR